MMYFLLGMAGNKPTSVFCCRYQHGLITRASVTCNIFVYFPFLSVVFLYADRKKNDLVCVAKST